MLTDRARILTRGVVEPVALAIGRTGLTPNMLTVAGTLLHVAVAWLLWQGWFAAGGVLLFIAAGIDGLDGSLARQTGRVSSFGAFLDSTFDRVSELLVFLGLVLHAERVAGETGALPFSPALAYAAMAGSVMVSYARARSESIDRPTKVGVMGRMERMAVVVVGLVTGWIPLMLWLVTLGTWFTTGWRVYDVWRQSRGDGRP